MIMSAMTMTHCVVPDSGCLGGGAGVRSLRHGRCRTVGPPFSPQKDAIGSLAFGLNGECGGAGVVVEGHFGLAVCIELQIGVPIECTAAVVLLFEERLIIVTNG